MSHRTQSALLPPPSTAPARQLPDLRVAIAKTATGLVSAATELASLAEELSRDLNQQHRFELLACLAALGREVSVVGSWVCDTSEQDRERKREITGQ